MSTITIEHGTIQIPTESLADGGVVVMSLGNDTYLMIRASDLVNSSPEQLEQLRNKTLALTQASDPYAKYHPSKARALREMRAKGIAVSGGEEYFSKPVTDPPPLEQVREELAHIKGNLSDLIIAEREEQW